MRLPFGKGKESNPGVEDKLIFLNALYNLGLSELERKRVFPRVSAGEDGRDE